MMPFKDGVMKNYSFLIHLLFILMLLIHTKSHADLKDGLIEYFPSNGNAKGDTERVQIAEAVNWLKNESHRLIRASRRTMKDDIAAFPPQVGIGYEAFWLRDFVYTLEGSIDSYSEKELREACKVFIQNIRSDGAGVDCVKYDGRPIYKPGYGTMGTNPVADG